LFLYFLLFTLPSAVTLLKGAMPVRSSGHHFQDLPPDVYMAPCSQTAHHVGFFAILGRLAQVYFSTASLSLSLVCIMYYLVLW